ncbi:transcriptional regulator [Variovorax paradoxus]|uniref:transcriptional regulator n=1 Tax=Variovorax paradoxus TaxID=34073 RepID=UPI0027D8478F|nr:helix-turn-helix domain-containing protein [Variovorax paradoxus]
METATPFPPIERAIAVVGSATALAHRLGVTPAAVGQWKSGERRVPAERCPEIERETGGVVRSEELRPDVAWCVLRCEGSKVGEGAHALSEREVPQC